jgi:RND family efflux transporter MFP subunit
MRTMKQAWWWLMGLAGVAVTAGLWTVASQGVASSSAGGASALSAKASSVAAAASAPPLEFQAHEIIRPIMASMPVTLTFSGPLTAPSTATVRAKASGTLQSLTVQEGSRVRAGQVIGRVDAADAASRVAERGAMLESARAALAQAERTLAQNESLAAQRFIAPAAVDSSRSAVETARAQFSAAQAALASTQLALAEAAIVSPIAGIVAKRHVLPGEKIGIEQQVVTIVDLRELELVALVPTHEVGRLASGMAVQVTVEGVDERVSGRVARIAPAAEPGSRAIGVTVTVPNANERLRAGQFGVAQARVADDKPRLVLPESSVISSAGQHQVWTLEAGALRRRSVTLGRQDASGGRVEVLEGLPADAQVLAARYDNLRDGALAIAAPAAASR